MAPIVSPLVIIPGSRMTVAFNPATTVAFIPAIIVPVTAVSTAGLEDASSEGK
jgi:hypothetical protein